MATSFFSISSISLSFFFKDLRRLAGSTAVVAETSIPRETFVMLSVKPHSIAVAELVLGTTPVDAFLAGPDFGLLTTAAATGAAGAKPGIPLGFEAALVL